jgi:disulfide bond formation protein DsbB
MSVFSLFACPRRRAFTVAALGATTLMAAVLLQHWLGWQPCPLCILQRLAILGVTLLALGAGLAHRRVLVAGAFRLGATGAAVGGCVAAYQQLMLLWGPTAATCGSSLRMTMTRLADALPWLDWLLDGSADCAADANRLAGLPLAFWVLALLVGTMALLWLPRRRAQD